MIFSAFGLAIRTDLPLPLPEISIDLDSPYDTVDVEVTSLNTCRMGVGPGSVQVGRWDRTVGDQLTLYREGDCYLLVRETARQSMMFRITKSRVTCIVDERGQPEDCMDVLLSGVFAFLLYLRGSYCLHGSAVARDDGVVAFLGGGGRGKSTIAASLVVRGWSLVADDVLPVREREGCMTAVPSMPCIKVDRHRAEKYIRILAPRAVYETHDGKEALFLTDDHLRCPSEGRPLKVLFVLKDTPARSGDGCTLKPLTGQDRMLKVLSYTFPSMFACEGTVKRALWEMAAKIASRLQMYYLFYPKRMSALAEVENIATDFAVREVHPK